DDAWKETRLGEAEQEAKDVEGVLCAQTRRSSDPRDEGHRPGDDAPGEQDARDPYPRADFVQDDVRGHFEQKIRKEEYARAEAERRLGELEVGIHRQLGEADVHSVEISDEIAEDQEGDESPGQLPDRTSFDFVFHKPLSRFDPSREGSWRQLTRQAQMGCRGRKLRGPADGAMRPAEINSTMNWSTRIERRCAPAPASTI